MLLPFDKSTLEKAIEATYYGSNASDLQRGIRISETILLSFSCLDYSSLSFPISPTTPDTNLINALGDY